MSALGTTPLDETALDDLGVRFRHARRAALRHVLESSSADETEEDLLTRARAADRMEAERLVFENARALGRSFVLHHRARLSLVDLPRILPALGVPCLDGVFSFDPEEPSLRLIRGACPSKGACDHFREALSGLVAGLTGDVLSRHESAGAGSERCVDAIHREPRGPSAFAPLPDDLARRLEPLVATVKRYDPSAELRFVGLREGVVHYELSRAPGGLSLATTIERTAARRCPGVVLRELAVRSPFG